MVAVVARCAVCGHVALTAFFVALKAVDSHPLAFAAMPNHVDITLDMRTHCNAGSCSGATIVALRRCRQYAFLVNTPAPCADFATLL